MTVLHTIHHDTSKKISIQIIKVQETRASTFSLSCLVWSNVIDGDEQVAVDSAQFQRAAEFLQSQRGLSALSLEEQKLLQSLDRLNHRLQCKFHPSSLVPVRTGITLYTTDS